MWVSEDQSNLHDAEPPVELLWRNGFQPREPWLGNAFMVPEEFESRLLGELLVKVPVADVQIFHGDKPRPDVGQHVLRRNKIHLDLPRFPQCSLSGRETVGTAADQKSKVLGTSHHLDGDPARRIAELKRAVDIETYQECQCLVLLLSRSW